jgi:hypothetical protein
MSETKIVTQRLDTASANVAMGANKITGLANGTASADAAAFGQIYYGFQAPVQATSTTIFSTTSSTYQTTNLSAAITPTSASHRVKITITGFARDTNATVTDLNLSIFRDAVDLASDVNGFARVTGASGQISIPISVSFIDSPATTSATTYAVKIKSSDNATAVSLGITCTQIIILEEIV